MGTPVYIIHPPKASTWIAEVRGVLTGPEWVAWDLVTIEMNRNDDFRVDAVLPAILRRPGPVVVFDCARKASKMLEAKLLTRSVVCVRATLDPADLWQHVVEATERHLDDDPKIPRKYVAAVCIVRKLYRRGFWGGTNEKNHQAVDDLLKGSIPPNVQGVARAVVDDLTNQNVLVPKYGGTRKDQKYALNHKRLDEIERIVRDGVFPDALMKILMRDKSTVGRSALDWPDTEKDAVSPLT